MPWIKTPAILFLFVRFSGCATAADWLRVYESAQVRSWSLVSLRSDNVKPPQGKCVDTAPPPICWKAMRAPRTTMESSASSSAGLMTPGPHKVSVSIVRTRRVVALQKTYTLCPNCSAECKVTAADHQAGRCRSPVDRQLHLPGTGIRCRTGCSCSAFAACALRSQHHKTVWSRTSRVVRTGCI